MSLISLPYIFSSGTTIIASQANSNNSTFLNAINGGLDNSNFTGTAGITYANLTLTGSIVNADISSSAAIVGSKIVSIAGSQLTGLSGIPSGSGVIPSANLPAFSFFPNGMQVFSSSGTWTRPAGVNNVYVKMWGAGGGGASAGAGNVASAGGNTSFAGTSTITAGGGGGATGSASPGTGGTANGTLNITGKNGTSGSGSNILTVGVGNYQGTTFGYGASSNDTNTNAASGGTGAYTEAVIAVTGNVTVTVGTGGAGASLGGTGQNGTVIVYY